MGRRRWFRRWWGKSREVVEAREGEQEVGDPDRPRPEVLHIEIPRWPGRAGEEVRWVVAPAPTGGAAWVVG